MSGQWTYLEFNLNAPATWAFGEIIAALFGVSELQVRTQAEFYTEITATSPGLFGYAVAPINHDPRFSLALFIETNLEFPDYDRLPLGVRLAELTGHDVAVGDYTSHCEFLVVKADGFVYYTDGVEENGWLNITERAATPIYYRDFPRE